MIGRLVLGGVLGALLFPFIRRLCPPAERLQIDVPASLAVVSSPISVSGMGQAVQHNELGLRVRDQGGAEIGTGVANVSGPLGQCGPFSGTVSYTLSGGSQPGRLEVFDTSPRDSPVVSRSHARLTPKRLSCRCRDDNHNERNKWLYPHRPPPAPRGLARTPDRPHPLHE